MRIAILSRNANLYSTSRLAEAALQREHDVEVVDPLRCYMNITSRRHRVLVRGEPLEKFDAVIPRIGASVTFYGTAVVRQLELAGTYSVNESQAIARSRDKLRSLQILARKGVPMPRTGFAHNTRDVDGVIASVGGAPLVIKCLEGTQGIGVVLAETNDAAASVIEAFRGLNANILVQEFVAEARGTDVRAFVVGEEVVASMERVAPEGEFRSNLHRGATARETTLSDDENRTALKAARALGLRVAGVDFMRSKDGPVVLEVNSSPGLQGIETCSGIDVALSIIRFVEGHAGSGRSRDDIRH